MLNLRSDGLTLVLDPTPKPCSELRQAGEREAEGEEKHPNVIPHNLQRRGFSVCVPLLCWWLGRCRTETHKGHSLSPSPKATSGQVQAGSERGSCILSPVPWAGTPVGGALRGSFNKHDAASLPPSLTSQAQAPAEAETLTKPLAGSASVTHVSPCSRGSHTCLCRYAGV